MKTKQFLKTKSKYLLLCATLLFNQFVLTAQAGAVKTAIEGWETDIENALDATVIVFGLVGGFIVFVQYMQGNEQAQKNFIKFVIGLAIFGLAKLIVASFV